MRRAALIVAMSLLSCRATPREQSRAGPPPDPLGSPTDRLFRPLGYTLQSASSYDRSGGNADARRIAPGETLVLMDAPGPGVVSHIWMTMASEDPDHLQDLILRMYWDGEGTPSVEAPVSAFFGLGLGEYVSYQSIPLAVAPARALNSFFPMPFRERAQITVENRGGARVSAFYFNIDWRAEHAPLPADTLYFHAQYRESLLCTDDDYVFMTAEGRGHFVGVTLSVVENTDGWWGEGDPRFFVDGESRSSIHGTGAEDYFLGAWNFGGKPFSYGTFGAPVVGREKAGEGWSMYRFHLDAPITFERALRAGIEHGHANGRADDYVSVAYWYQTEPHAAFPPLPPSSSRKRR